MPVFGEMTLKPLTRIGQLQFLVLRCMNRCSELETAENLGPCLHSQVFHDLTLYLLGAFLQLKQNRKMWFKNVHVNCTLRIICTGSTLLMSICIVFCFHNWGHCQGTKRFTSGLLPNKHCFKMSFQGVLVNCPLRMTCTLYTLKVQLCVLFSTSFVDEAIKEGWGRELSALTLFEVTANASR